MIPAGTGVDADFCPVRVSEMVQDAVIQRHECTKQTAGRIQLERQAPFSEIYLNVVSPGVEALADVPDGFASEIV